MDKGFPDEHGLEQSLPSRLYTSPEAFARERERIFATQWLCVGREEDLPNAGVKVIEIAGESILLARTKSGALKAHYNVCRHRGAKLCAEKRWDIDLPGGATANGLIVCPYHQWSYSLDGDLVSAPLVGAAPGFDRRALSLYPVAVDLWGGFVFVNLTPATAAAPGATLAESLALAPQRLGNYPLADLKTAQTITYDVRANWKIIFENYNECYHCPGVHPELCEIVPEFRKNAGRHLDWEAGIPHREGAWTYTWTGTADRAPFPGLSEEEKVRHKGELMYPNVMLSMSAEHAAAFILWPLAADMTRIECRFLFHPDEMAKTGFDPSDAVTFWDLVNRQDWSVCERVQQGVSSRAHAFGFYAPLEDLSLDIRAYVGRFFTPEELAR